MKLLESKKKINLPKVFFITDKSEIKDIPIGIPFILADLSLEDYVIRLLEYEVLFEAALKSGYPFNFKKILQDNGYNDIVKFGYDKPLFIEFNIDTYKELDLNYDYNSIQLNTLKNSQTLFKEYIKDSACYVDISKLKSLNVFPIWLDNIEKALSTNIHNYATFDHNLYNKKLEGMYGAISLNSPNKNLIVIDISSSIPKGVSSTILAISKNIAESFYADIMITGSKTTLYEYENIYKLNISTIYEQNGISNESKMYRELVTKNEKQYETIIGFGDNHSPLDNWNSSGYVSLTTAKKLCKWKANKIISFHTNNNSELAGYLSYFDCNNVENVKNWVKYMN